MKTKHPLARWRQQQKPAPWRQEDLAREAKVERWTVAFLESGRDVTEAHRVALADLTGLYKALGVTEKGR